MSPRREDDLLDAWLEGEPDLADELAARIRSDPSLARRLVARARLEGDLGLMAAELAAAAPVRQQRRRSLARRSRPRRRLAPVLGLAVGVVAILAVALLLFGRPQATAPSFMVEVVSVEGAVQLADGAPLQAGMLVESPATLVVPVGAVLDLHAATGDELRLSAADNPARLTLPGLPGDPWNLEAGSCRVVAARRSLGNPALALNTEHLGLEVLGTRFTVTAQASGSVLSVDEGTVRAWPAQDHAAAGDYGPGQGLVLAADDAATLPEPWSLGEPLASGGYRLVASGSILAAGAGDPHRDTGQVLRWHPDTRVQVRYRAAASCHWIGLWWRNVDTGSTYHLPLGRVQGDGTWVTVEARLGDAAVNGVEARPPRAGDSLNAFSIQTGRGDGAWAEVDTLRFHRP